LSLLFQKKKELQIWILCRFCFDPASGLRSHSPPVASKNIRPARLGEAALMAALGVSVSRAASHRWLTAPASGSHGKFAAGCSPHPDPGTARVEAGTVAQPLASLADRMTIDPSAFAAAIDTAAHAAGASPRISAAGSRPTLLCSAPPLLRGVPGAVIDLVAIKAAIEAAPTPDEQLFASQGMPLKFCGETQRYSLALSVDTQLTYMAPAAPLILLDLGKSDFLARRRVAQNQLADAGKRPKV
jgi:hypothetical protein